MTEDLTSKRTRVPGGSVDLTRKRILVAAELVFSRDGFQGATTREIAREAGVNEVTKDLSTAADFIRDAVHSAMLRHTAYGHDAESVAAYLKGVTEIFYQGIKS